jgi:hypothetical protein
VIYFIQIDGGGPIKIGYTSGTDVRPRLRAIQTSVPYPLAVIHTMPGELADERNLHERFAEWRMHGEWFQPGPSLVLWLRDRRASPFGANVIPHLRCHIEERRHGPLTARDAAILEAASTIGWARTRDIAAWAGVGSSSLVAARLRVLRDAYGRVESHRVFNDPTDWYLEWRGVIPSAAGGTTRVSSSGPGHEQP